MLLNSFLQNIMFYLVILTAPIAAVAAYRFHRRSTAGEAAAI